MRILFLSQWFDPEPAAIRGLPLARWLHNRGHQVEVITGFPNYPGGRLYPGYRLRWRQREIRDEISILRVPLYPSHSNSAVGRITNYLSFMISAGTIGSTLAGPADVLFVYHPPPTVGVAGLALKGLRGLPMVYHIADMWPESVVQSGMLGRGKLSSFAEACLGRLCAALYRTATSITVLSPGLRRLLMERGVPGEKIHVVYNWAEEEQFFPVERDEQLARELGLAGRFNIVYAGNLGPAQGLDTLLHAAQRLRDFPEIQIVLIGAGLERDRLQRLAGTLNAKNVRFLENRPCSQMGKINALADVLVIHLRDLPFFASTIPGKTQVAMASGRPILMAVRGDAADVVRASGAGIVAEPENPADLAEAVLTFYRMPAAEREARGQRGRDFYLREMSQAVGGAQMEALFAEAVRSPSCSRTELAGRLLE